MTTRAPLEGERVVAFTTGIAGGYAAKVLRDAGAEVVTVEPPGGDSFRTYSASGTPASVADPAPLYRFLHGGQASRVADPSKPDDVRAVLDLVTGADGVVWTPGTGIGDHPDLAPEALAAAAPAATVVALTPYGLSTPWTGRPATEATLQALSGGPAIRGTLDTPPLIVGGQLGDWETGTVAALAYLISRHRRVQSGWGELVDVSALEACCLTNVMYPVTFTDIAGFPMRPVRMTNVPGIHPAADGWVGFMVVTGQQWLDFTVMVERPDWGDDESLLRMAVRAERRAELVAHIDTWTAAQPADTIAELADALRIPVAVLGNGASLPDTEHFRQRSWFVEHPGAGFLQPDVPYTLGAGAERRPPAPAPALGTDRTSWDARPRPSGQPPTDRPFAGLRVLDFCNNWAGPIIGHVLAMFGADVIKVESIAKPDPLRYNTIKGLDDPDALEWSPLQHGPNTSKRDLTLDMSTAAGRDRRCAWPFAVT